MSRPHVAQSAADSAGLAARGLDAVGGTAVTIGNFDGVHCGHAALIHAARAAIGMHGRVLALAFDPSPAAVLRPETRQERLSTFVQRARWLRELGASEVQRIEPSREFLKQDAQAFIAQLVQTHRPRFIVEGPDFRFGRDRGGSIDTLRQFESRFDYQVIVVDPVEVVLADQSILRASSSLARWLLSQGRAHDAAIVLGRPFEIESQVVRGDQRGRDLGFPTANLAVAGGVLLPADGVYAGTAQRDDLREFPAAISVGSKPTFGHNPRTCEAHLLDYHGPLDEYGWTIRLRFTHWLRDQLIFSGIDPLVQQMQRDVQRIRIWTGPGQPAPERGLHATNATS